MTIRRVLYYVIPEAELPDELDDVHQHIIEHWTKPHWLFGVSQIADRTGKPRRKVRRSIAKLERAGVVGRHSGGYKGKGVRTRA